MKSKTRTWFVSSRFILVVTIFFICCIVSGQAPQPLVVKPLPPPMSGLYLLEEAGLIGVANRHEIQLWDIRSKACYGTLAVIAPEFQYSRITHIEYLKDYNKVAVVWEEQFTDSSTQKPAFTDNLTLFSPETLLPDFDSAHYGSGMARLIKYKYANKTSLPAFKNEKNIYRYHFDRLSGNFITIDRNGNIELYRKTQWIKSITTGAIESQLVFPAKDDSLIYVSDKVTGTLIGINSNSGKRELTIPLMSIPAKGNASLPGEHNLFSVTVVSGQPELCLIDSVNRLRYVQTNTGKITSSPLSSFRGITLISAVTNLSDSSIYGIAEQEMPPYNRMGFYANIKTSVFNIFSGGAAPFISAAYATGLNTKFRMVVSGINETELDLSNLTERNLAQFYSPFNERILWTGSWETGYFHVIQNEQDETQVKVFKSDSAGSYFLYRQNLQLKPGEQLAALFPAKKWYFTTGIEPEKSNFNKLNIFDSTGKKLKTLDVRMPVQTIYTSSSRQQQIFSKDGSYFMLKEFLEVRIPFNTCRLRIITTNNLATIFDTSYTEHSDFNPYNHRTATFADSSNGFYFITATPGPAGKPNTSLFHYSLEKGKAFKRFQTNLCLEPACITPFTVRNITLSRDGKNLLWFGFVAGDKTKQQAAYQFVVITDAVSGIHQRGMNMPPMPELIKALPFPDYFGLQFTDRIDFLQAFPTGVNHFLTVIHYINDNTYELSTVFVTPDYTTGKPFFSSYYEKTNNNDCISFKWGNKSYKRRQFDVTYNRPDLVLAKIPGFDSGFQKLYFNAVNKRAERLPGKLQNFKPEEMPELSLVETYYSKNGKFTLVVKVHSKTRLSHFYISINGNRMEKNVKSKDDQQKHDLEQTWRFSETLTNGENIIELIVVTESGIESMPLRLTQIHSRDFEKPNLHLLAVSAGKYSNGLTQLPFAVKDGRDIAYLFNQFRRDTLFKNVFIDTLFDEAVSQSAVLEWMESKEELMPSDYVIVFYSGHGFLDSRYNLRLATSSTDISSPEKRSIDYEAIIQKMDRLEARQKLFLVDACHSGDFDRTGIKKDTAASSTDTTGNAKGIRIKYKTGNSFEMMQNLFSFSEEGNGTVVISASGGTQSAYEAARYRNGFFTYALKEAIAENKAASDPLNRLWINQLVKYIRQRVTEMSGGNQVPNLRISNPDLNWRIK